MVRDGCIQRCGVNSPMNYRSLVYVLSTVRLLHQRYHSTQYGLCLACGSRNATMRNIACLERNHSLRSGKIPFSPTIPFIVAPV